MRERARGRGEKGGQAGARAGRNVEAGDRRAHRTRGDVDDPAELSLRHPRRQRLNQRDRRQHVGFDAGEDVLAREGVEGPGGRAAIVVDENVGLRACGEQRRARRRIVEVARDFVHGGARDRAQFAARFAARASASRPLTMISQPASASASAQARPRPRLEAQTIALRPAIPKSIAFSLPSTRPGMGLISAATHFVTDATRESATEIAAPVPSPREEADVSETHRVPFATERCSSPICIWERAAARPISSSTCCAISRPDTIYLVGDIIDGWRLRSGWYWPQAHNDVMQKLLRKVRRGRAHGVRAGQP